MGPDKPVYVQRVSSMYVVWNSIEHAATYSNVDKRTDDGCAYLKFRQQLQSRPPAALHIFLSTETVWHTRTRTRACPEALLAAFPTYARSVGFMDHETSTTVRHRVTAHQCSDTCASVPQGPYRAVPSTKIHHSMSFSATSGVQPLPRRKAARCCWCCNATRTAQRQQKSLSRQLQAHAGVSPTTCWPP